MNVLLLHASPRRRGVTSALLSDIEASLRSDHRVRTVRIAELEMKPCIGFLKCRPDRPCILPPGGANELCENVRWADFIVIGCPVYWGNMPGPLKTFFDRNVPLFEYAETKAIRCIPRPQLRGKRAAIVVSAVAPFPCNLSPSQSRGTIGALKTILKAGGVRVEWVLNVADSWNFESKKGRYLRRARRLAGSI